MKAWSTFGEVDVVAIHAGVTGHLETHEGAQEAVSGGGAGVELDAATSAEADRVVFAVVRLNITELGANTAADAEAGFGAGDVEEACAVGGADANVFDGAAFFAGRSAA